jgi:phosphoserine aminotransferase
LLGENIVMTRARNFNPGPGTLPLAALERAQAELLDIAGSGMSILEHSHRGKVYEAIHNETIQLLTELLGIPESHCVLFLQGGASQQFATVPMNFLKAGQSADYVVTGVWAKKALSEAKIVGTARAAADTAVEGKFRRVPKPEELKLAGDAAYVHITTNNTVAGTQWHSFPDVGKVPLIADMSSDILWRPTDVSKFALIYAGAQKNMGPAGVTVVIADKEFVAQGRKDIPTIFQYRTHQQENSLYNTPPCFAIYMLRNVLAEVKRTGGLQAMEAHNRKKAQLLYDAIDARSDFYRCPIEKDSRSVMNVVFNLPSEAQEEDFIKKASAQGLVGLKGHRLVGGVRASIYNAAPLAWVEELVEFMRKYS